MPPAATPPQRFGVRLAATATIGLLAAGAAAAPASAQVIGIADPYINPVLPYSVTRGEAPTEAVVEIGYTRSAGYEHLDHAVSMEVEFDVPSGTLEIAPGDGCDQSVGVRVQCNEMSVDDYWVFDFDLSVSADDSDAELTVPYSVVVAIDGYEVARETGSVYVFDDGATNRNDPFLHGGLEFTEVAPGSAVEAKPTFYQQENLAEGTAALVATFTDSFSRIGLHQEGAEAIADYDNCVEETEDPIRGGVKCVITDFTDRPETALTFTDPIRLAISADTLGPFQICECVYYVDPISAATLEAEFGDLTWDPASTNLFGVTTADSWTAPADPEDSRYGAEIKVTTSANPADLTVTGAALQGYVGAKDSATATVVNNGPATVYNRSDDHGSISIRAELPEGTTVAALPTSSSGWSCLNQASLAAEYARTTTTLDRYDLYCFLLTPLAAGASVDFTFTANLVGEGSGSGRVEIATLTTGPNGESLESTLDDNVGAIESQAEQNPAPEIPAHSDYNGDGLSDLLAVRASDGALMFYAGKGDGTFAAGVSKGIGWGRMDVVMAGDLTADGKADLLARDTKTGTLYTYPGNGSGGFGTRITVGTGWNALGAFTSAGDFNSDGKLDLYAVGKSDGKLYFYPGLGNGKFGTRTAAGTGWGVMDVLASVGDLDDDGKADLLAHDSRTGQYYLYKGDGAGNLGGRVTIAATLDGSGSDRFSQIAAVGDQDGDGREDLVAVDSRTGELELHSLNGNGTAVHAGRIVATGWGGNRLAAVNEERAYDYNGDGATDFVARRNSDGTTYLYPGTGTGAHGTRVSWGTALNGMTLIATAGDMNGDGFADVLARTSGGTLYLYPGTGSGALNTAGRITIGSGWNAMGTIISGHDYNTDGKTDVIAVGSDGTLWLYPGTGDGRLGARKSIGSSWTSMKEATATGDLDHDGHADMVAVRVSDGCLYFYGGKGDGTFKPMAKIGCGWSAMDAITGIGDFDRDGHVDWLARRKSDGVLFFYPGNGAGNHSAAKVVGTGWNAMTIA